MTSPMPEPAPSATRWRYRAADASGSAVTGEIDAHSERDAIDALRRRSLWVVSLAPSTGVAGGGRNARTADSGIATIGSPGTRSITAIGPVNGGTTAGRFPLLGTRFGDWQFGRTDASRTSPQELAAVTRAIATLLSAGVPLDRALAYAAAQAPDESSRAVFASVRDAVRNGQSFSGAIASHTVFPTYFAPTLSAGEASGTLPLALERLAEHVERSAAVRSKLRAALIYPAILGVASIIGVTVIMVLVVPRFATLIQDSGGTLPTSTRLLIAVSTLITRGWWVLLTLAVLATAGWQRAMADVGTRLRWHRWRLTWPIIGALERSREAAAYTGTLSVALTSGVGLLSAMGLARAVVQNLHIVGELGSAEAQVRDGRPVAVALTGVLPPLAVRLLDAGEIGGDLAGLAARAANTADEQVQQAVNRAVTLVEPILILGFGGLVGFVALALLQAIYGINARSL